MLMKVRQVLIPNALVTQTGEKVLTSEQWIRTRRPEIIDLFQEHVYGAAPVNRPKDMKFVVDTKEGVMDGRAIRKQIVITYEGPGGKGNIHLLLFLPTGVHKPVPAFLLINNRDICNTDPERIVKSSFWPAEVIIARGYAVASFQVSDLDPDNYDGFKNGVHGIFDSKEKQRSADTWGTISAWAWGASRVMDYFETDEDIDIKRVALVGHSRGGKTALWCGALDERFSMVVSNNSGSTGAAIARGKKGETIKKINDQFPHWFCGNYKNYNDKEEELPVDQHMLIALMAPRHVYVTSATEDEWSDPESEFLSCVHAGPVYQLFNLKGMELDEMPEPDTPVFGQNIAYHIRTGKHDLTEYDWHCFMDYADKNLRCIS